MGPARVTFTDDAWDDWCDLDRSAQLTVGKAIAKLETDPHLRGAPLGNRSDGSLTSFRKLPAGRRKEYRVVYRVDPDGTVVVIWVIGLRANDEAYKMARARLRLDPNPAVRALIDSLDELWEC